MIHVAPRASCADRYGPRGGVNPRVFYRPKVDDQSVVTNSQSARVVSSAAHGKKQIMFSRKIYRVDYIRCIRATGDQTRPFVYHSVVHFASFIISLIARLYEPASKVR